MVSKIAARSVASSSPSPTLFLALAPNLVAGYGAGMSGDLAGTFLSFIFIPLSIGALAAINTWDLPTYFVGQVVGSLTDEPPAGRVVIEMVDEFIDAVQRLDRLCAE